jgi:hypothetical protein
MRDGALKTLSRKPPREGGEWLKFETFNVYVREERHHGKPTVTILYRRL